MAECNDPKCPYHGTISVRGAILKGRVKSAKAKKTVTVETERVVKVPKFERYQKEKIRFYAHNPECINAKEGDEVIAGETRKISKTKAFVVLQKVGEEKPKRGKKK